MKERQAIGIENALIILSIAALWPAILRWPPRVAWPALAGALAAMLVVNVNRWRRLMRLRDRARAESEDADECGKGDRGPRS